MIPPASSAASVRPRVLAGLPLALGLGLALLLLSYARRVGDLNSILINDRVLDSILAGSIVGTALAGQLLGFAVAIIALHLVLGVAVWTLALSSEVAWPSVESSRYRWVWLWFALIVLGLLAANATDFPHTSLGEPYAGIARSPLLGTFAGRLPLAIVSALALLTLTSALWRRRHRRLVRYVGGAAALVAAGIAVAVIPTRGADAPGATHAPPKRPNVVLIGIDSLRPELLDRAGPGDPLPHIRRFVGDSTRFTDAITPLARTFPSWIALLTGRHPHSTGAVMNLLPRAAFHSGPTLAEALRDAGYRTAYAIDEVRFSNIDGSYGFDQTITPPIGAAEFLIGWVSDTPLSNLVVNTRAGALLFPRVHANRGIAATYDPSAFVARVDRELETRQPLFLALHLTLAHWPYLWTDAPAARSPSATDMEAMYLAAVQRVDRQFADMLAVLEARGVLRDALVIVFSDHGESFGLPQDALVAPDLPLLVELQASPTWGHGTSVLSPHQYRILLAARGFGSATAWSGAPRRITAPVSIEDVAPTVAQLLDLPARSSFDGRSLAPLLSGSASAWPDVPGRVRFTETEFNPPGLFGTPGVVSTSAVTAATAFYRVDRLTGRVEARPEHLRELVGTRQFAALGPTRLLAAVPRFGTGGHALMLVDLGGGLPRRVEGPPDPTADPEAAALWNALHERYADALGDARVAVSR